MSLVLAALFVTDMNEGPLFDTLWMTELNLDVVAILPQLWLVRQTGRISEALVRHYIAAMAVSRISSGLFMCDAKTTPRATSGFTGFQPQHRRKLKWDECQQLHLRQSWLAKTR